MMAQITRTPFLMLNASNDPITEALNVVDDTMEFAVAGVGGEFNNIYSEQTKSAGDLAIGILSAIRGKCVFDQAGASASQMMGIEAECVIMEGSPIIASGIKCLLQSDAAATPASLELFQGALVLAAGGATGNTRGVRSQVTIDGDITGFVRGLDVNLDINAAGTVSSQAAGLRIQIDNDGAVSGDVYGIDLDDRTGVTYGYFQSGSAPNRFGGQLSIGGDPPSVNFELGAVSSGILCLKEGVTPTADLTFGKLYFKDDNKAYVQTGDGVEHELAFV